MGFAITFGPPMYDPVALGPESHLTELYPPSPLLISVGVVWHSMPKLLTLLNGVPAYAAIAAVAMPTTPITIR